jgi:hypothetical protein
VRGGRNWQLSRRLVVTLPPIPSAFLAAQRVMPLRCVRLAAGGALAKAEADRMITETEGHFEAVLEGELDCHLWSIPVLPRRIARVVKTVAKNARTSCVTPAMFKHDWNPLKIHSNPHR